MLLTGCVLAVDLVGKFVGRSISTAFLGKENFILIFLISVLLFYLSTRKSSLENNNLITLSAQSTLSVYLLHENGLLLRPFLWNKLFCAERLQNSCFLIPYSIIVVASVFIGAVIIDQIRVAIFGNLEKALINKFDTCFEMISRLGSSNDE